MRGVVGFKIANNRNGLACSDSNLYRMSGTVVDVGVLILLTPARNRNLVDWMKFTKRVPKVIDKEGADADSRITNNCNVLQVVKLLVVNKGVDAEGVVVCLTHGNNRNGPVCREFKIYKFRSKWMLSACKYMSRCTKACQAR